MSLAIRESSGSSQLTELGKHLHLLKNREFTPVSPIPAQPRSVYFKLHFLLVRNLAPIVLNRLTFFAESVDAVSLLTTQRN